MNSLQEIQFSAITVMQEIAAKENAPDIQTTGLGEKIPRLYGRVLTAGNIFWIEDNTVKTQIWNDQEVKFATFALALGLCPEGNFKNSLAVTRIWARNHRIYNILTDTANPIKSDVGFDYENSGCYTGKTNLQGFQMAFQFFPGTLTQPKCKLIARADGFDNTPRFPSLCYIVFTNFPLFHYDNDLSSLDLKVELIRPREVF